MSIDVNDRKLCHCSLFRYLIHIHVCSFTGIFRVFKFCNGQLGFKSRPPLGPSPRMWHYNVIITYNLEKFNCSNIFIAFLVVEYDELSKFLFNEKWKQVQKKMIKCTFLATAVLSFYHHHHHRKYNACVTGSRMLGLVKSCIGTKFTSQFGDLIAVSISIPSLFPFPLTEFN